MRYLLSFLVSLFLCVCVVRSASPFNPVAAQSELETRIRSLNSLLTNPTLSVDRTRISSRLSLLEHYYFSLSAALADGRPLDKQNLESPHIQLKKYQRAIELQQKKLTGDLTYEERVLVQHVIAALIERSQALQARVNAVDEPANGATTQSGLDADAVDEPGFGFFSRVFNSMRGSTAVPSFLPTPAPTAVTLKQISLMEAQGQLLARNIAGAGWHLASPDYWSSATPGCPHTVVFAADEDNAVFFNLWVKDWSAIYGGSMNPLKEIARFAEIIAVATAASTNADPDTQTFLQNKILQASVIKEQLEKHPQTAQFNQLNGPKARNAPIQLFSEKDQKTFYEKWKTAYKANTDPTNFDAAGAFQAVQNQIANIQGQAPTMSPADLQRNSDKLNQLNVIKRQMMTEFPALADRQDDADTMAAVDADLFEPDPFHLFDGAGDAPVMGGFGGDPDSAILEDDEHWDAVIFIPLQPAPFFDQWLANWASLHRGQPFVALQEYKNMVERSANLKRLMPSVSIANPKLADRMSIEAGQFETLKKEMLRRFPKQLANAPIAVSTVSSREYLANTMFADPFANAIDRKFGGDAEIAAALDSEQDSGAAIESVVADEGTQQFGYWGQLFGAPSVANAPSTLAPSQSAPLLPAVTDPKSPFFQTNRIDQARGDAYDSFVSQWKASNPGKTFDPLTQYTQLQIATNAKRRALAANPSASVADQIAKDLDRNNALMDGLALVIAGNPITDEAPMDIKSDRLPTRASAKPFDGGYLTPEDPGTPTIQMESPLHLSNYAYQLVPDTITPQFDPLFVSEATIESVADADSLDVKDESDRRPLSTSAKRAKKTQSSQ